MDKATDSDLDTLPIPDHRQATRNMQSTRLLSSLVILCSVVNVLIAKKDGLYWWDYAAFLLAGVWMGIQAIFLWTNYDLRAIWWRQSAITNTWSALGPEGPCSNTQCDGCRYEWETALEELAPFVPDDHPYGPKKFSQKTEGESEPWGDVTLVDGSLPHRSRRHYPGIRGDETAPGSP